MENRNQKTIEYLELLLSIFQDKNDKMNLSSYRQDFNAGEVESLIEELKFDKFTSDGIVVQCICKNEKVQKAIDKQFHILASMDIIDTGLYKGYGDCFSGSFLAIERIFKNKGLVKNIVIFRRWVDGEEEDILEYYHNKMNPLFFEPEDD